MSLSLVKYLAYLNDRPGHPAPDVHPVAVCVSISAATSQVLLTCCWPFCFHPHPLIHRPLGWLFQMQVCALEMILRFLSVFTLAPEGSVTP